MKNVTNAINFNPESILDLNFLEAFIRDVTQHRLVAGNEQPTYTPLQKPEILPLDSLFCFLPYTLYLRFIFSLPN